jgi:methylmalonyl-CoA mutase
MNKASLFEDFEPTSEKQWKQKIQFELQGKDFNDTLVWKSIEGIDVKPFYHLESYSKSPKIEYNSSDWNIGHSIFVNSVEKSNIHALYLIESGVECLYFTIPLETINIEALLENIDLSRIPIYFETLFISVEFTKKLQQYSVKKKHNILYTK